MNTGNGIQDRKNSKKKHDLGEWIIYGMLVGTLAGIVFGDLTKGMILGISLGIVIGTLANR